MNRRRFLAHMGAIATLPARPAQNRMRENILKRSIPSSNEAIPVIGLGTWQTFDVRKDQAAELKEVLRIFNDHGGTVVDSSPMYGRSEQVVGQLSDELGINDKLFMATKVWTSGRDDGIRQMQDSFAKMQRTTMDLMQIHNLVDWQTHLQTLRTWKEEQRVRYIGLTHYTESAHDKLIDIMKKERVDFVQINYNLNERNAEKRLLPFALDNGIAVIVNQPFDSGTLFSRVRGKSLPPLAREIQCKSWAQFFLKWIISHPAVTCAIPGTGKTEHMRDNIAAGFGLLPSLSQRAEMSKLFS